MVAGRDAGSSWNRSWRVTVNPELLRAGPLLPALTDFTVKFD